LNICPNNIVIRRTHDVGSDKIDIISSGSIASIQSIIIHIDEPVSIMLLAFHTKNKYYCRKYKNEDADKKFCDNKIDYIHFYLSLEGFPSDESKYLIGFLPRYKNIFELEKLADEFCKVTEWLKVTERVNCLVFRYGLPVHGTDNIDTRQLYIIHQMEGMIRHIPQKSSNKNLTVSKNSLFNSITVS
jgi:hypothetical protein